jgi:hypothetical protein
MTKLEGGALVVSERDRPRRARLICIIGAGHGSGEPAARSPLTQQQLDDPGLE